MKIFSVEFNWRQKPNVRAVGEHEEPEWVDWNAERDKLKVWHELALEVRVFSIRSVDTPSGKILADFLQRNFSQSPQGLVVNPDADLFNDEGAQAFWAGSAGIGLPLNPVNGELPGRKRFSTLSPVFVFDLADLERLGSMVRDYPTVAEEYFAYNRIADWRERGKFASSVVTPDRFSVTGSFGSSSVLQFRVPESARDRLRALYSKTAILRTVS